MGVLSALAPSRSRVIAQIAPSAMICGFVRLFTKRSPFTYSFF